jgi:hypothetical protein
MNSKMGLRSSLQLACWFVAVLGLAAARSVLPAAGTYLVRCSGSKQLIAVVDAHLAAARPCWQMAAFNA